MNIHFIAVNQDTIEQAIALQVSSTQIGLVESVRESYDESLQFSFWKPVMILDNQEPIGFAMYGLYPGEKENELWLDRFFIDQHQQGKGYAKSVLRALLKQMEDIYGAQPVYLSVYKENTLAIKIYQTIGFVFTDRIDENGELVMILEIK